MSLEGVTTTAATMPGYFASGTLTGQILGLTVRMLAAKGGEAALNSMTGTTSADQPTGVAEGVAKAAAGAGVGYLAGVAATGPYGLAASAAVSLAAPAATAVAGYATRRLFG